MISPKARAFLFAKKRDVANGVAPSPKPPQPYGALQAKLSVPEVPTVQPGLPRKKRLF